MKINKSEIIKGEIEITIQVETSEMTGFLKKAAARLSKDIKIDGFRPGAAPYEIVKQKAGEMKIYEYALDDIITHYYWLAIDQEKINSIGQPNIDIKKFAPGNDLEFSAKVAVLPEVTLGKYKQFNLKKNDVKVDKTEVDKVINELREMRVSEAAKLTSVVSGDKVEVDFNISLNGNAIDNGQAKKFPLIVGKGQMIPGFEEQIVGMMPGEEKTFKLKFPESYHDNKVAGQECEFAIKVQNVFKRELPKMDDDFAKQVGGFKDMTELKQKIEDNIKMEKEYKENQRVEIDMLDKITEDAKFGEIPDLLVNTEAHRMVHELQNSIEQQGMVWDHYLQSIKKDHDALEKEFKPGALKRVKTSLIMRQISQVEKLVVTPDEVDKEIAKLKIQFKDNPEAQQNLNSDGYKKYLENSLNNEKVLNFLREQNIVAKSKDEKKIAEEKK